MASKRITATTAPYDKDVQAAFNIIMPSGAEPLNIFRTVGVNPRVLTRMVTGGLLDRGSISIADRELVILRACARCRAEYEWGVHVALFADKAGFSGSQIAATCEPGSHSAVWSTSQKLLVEMVDALHDTATIPDEMWANLREAFTEEQLVELIMLAGLYHAVSFVVNGLGVEHERFAPGVPSMKSAGVA